MTEPTEELACFICGESDHDYQGCTNVDAIQQFLANAKQKYSEAYQDIVLGAGLCQQMELPNIAAEILGWSKTRAKNIGNAWKESNANWWPPDIPLSAIRAALSAPDGHRQEALAMAIEGKSARDINDYYQLTFYKRSESATKFSGEPIVDVWEPDTGTVQLTGMPISGKKPQKVKATLKEILES